jgi:hypothetical protein
MTLDDYLSGLRPKVQGTLNLNSAFGSPLLDFFITLSSVSAILGKTGQMNYSAANSFQDAFAHENAGKSHTQYISLNLGAIDGSEAITSLPTRQRELMRQGAILMSFNELFKALEYSMGPDARRDGCIQSVFGFDRLYVNSCSYIFPVLARIVNSESHYASRGKSFEQTMSQNL